MGRRKSADDTVKADAQVADSTSSHWRQAQKSAAIVSSMRHELTKEARSVRQKFGDLQSGAAKALETLRARLESARIKREELLKKAAILDTARAHFIGGPTRLFFAFVTSLLVIYLCFQILMPVGKFVLHDQTFWYACLAGVCGAILAVVLSYCVELRAGNSGVKRASRYLERARRESPHAACQEYSARMNECAIQIAYYLSLHNTKALTNRLFGTLEVSSATARNTAVPVEEDLQEQDEHIRAMDRARHDNGSLLQIHIGPNDGGNNNHEQELLKKVRRKLDIAWASIAIECDELKHGSYPESFVIAKLSHCLRDTAAWYYENRFDHQMRELAQGENTMTGLTAPDYINDFTSIHGGAGSHMPFLSCGLALPRGGVANRYMYAYYDRIATSYIKDYEGIMGCRVDARAFDPKIPILGLYLQEMPLDLPTLVRESGDEAP